MVGKRRRFDPYKAFKFRVVAAAGLAGVVAFAIMKRLSAAAPKRRKDGAGSVPIEGVEPGPRPIEPVGTSTAGFVGTSPKPARR